MVRNNVKNKLAHRRNTISGGGRSNNSFKRTNSLQLEAAEQPHGFMILNGDGLLTQDHKVTGNFSKFASSLQFPGFLQSKFFLVLYYTIYFFNQNSFVIVQMIARGQLIKSPAFECSKIAFSSKFFLI